MRGTDAADLGTVVFHIINAIDVSVPAAPRNTISTHLGLKNLLQHALSLPEGNIPDGSPGAGRPRHKASNELYQRVTDHIRRRRNLTDDKVEEFVAKHGNEAQMTCDTPEDAKRFLKAYRLSWL